MHFDGPCCVRLRRHLIHRMEGQQLQRRRHNNTPNCVGDPACIEAVQAVQAAQAVQAVRETWAAVQVHVLHGTGCLGGRTGGTGSTGTCFTSYYLQALWTAGLSRLLRSKTKSTSG
jgi:hypothetical protein